MGASSSRSIYAKAAFRLRMVSVGLLIAGAGVASGQHYPNKPVRMVTAEVGAAGDFVARVVALGLSDSLGQQVIVENRGGSGVIPIGIVAKALPDGYTLLVFGSTLWLLPFIQDVSYDPVRDFSPITLAATTPLLLVVHPSLPVKTLQDFIALAKARSGQINYGASSAATMLPMEMLKQMAAMDLTHIPYKGTGPALTAMLGGEVQAMFGGAINTILHVRSGRLRALAVAGSRRASGLPDVPTVAESGYPGYAADSWNGVLAPAGTPRALVMRLNADIHKVVQSPRFREIMAGDGADPVVSTPEAFAERIRIDYAKWRQVIEKVGLRKD